MSDNHNPSSNIPPPPLPISTHENPTTIANMGIGTKPTKPVRANSANASAMAAALAQSKRPRRASESKSVDVVPTDAAKDKEKGKDKLLDKERSTSFFASIEQQWNRRKSQWFRDDESEPMISPPSSTQTQTQTQTSLAPSAGPTTTNKANGKTPTNKQDDDAQCHICNLPLRMLRRRHQCRNCNLPVCSAHSQNQMPLPHLGIMREARVCDICVHELVARRAGVRQPKRRTRSTSSQSDTPLLDTPPSSPPNHLSSNFLMATVPTLDSVPTTNANANTNTSSNDSAMSGVLFSCLLEEQANIMDEILYVSTFRMGGRALASRHMNANVAIWKERWCMLTSAELLTFKATTPTTPTAPSSNNPNSNVVEDPTLPVIALGELRTSVHLTDILHIEVHDEYPRILSIMKSDGRMFRVRTKSPEQCQELALTLNRAQQDFQHIMDRVNRGGSIDDFAIACVTVQHESSLSELVVASSPVMDDLIHVDMYPSSLLRFYVNSPEGSAVAAFSSQMLQSCDPTKTNELLIVTNAEAPNKLFETRSLQVSLRRQSASSALTMGKNVAVWAAVVALGATATAIDVPERRTFVAVLFLTMLVLFIGAFHDPLLLLWTTRRVHFAKRFCVQCVKIAYSDTSAIAELDDDEEWVASLPDDQLDIRFVEGCKNDYREARERLLDTLRWRKRERMDEILVRPQPFFDIMKQSYTHFLHKRDRYGHVVSYGQFGQMKKMHEYFSSRGVSDDAAVSYHMFVEEYMWDVIDPRPYPDGTLLAIFDIKGISMSDISGDVFTFMRNLGETMGDRYPERLFHTFVLNPPAWFSLLWKLVLPSINPKTRERVHVVRGQKEIAKELLEFIDEKSLPVEYGGKCECPGGCFTHSPEECDARNFVHTYLNGMEEGDPRIAEALDALKQKYREQNKRYEAARVAV